MKNGRPKSRKLCAPLCQDLEEFGINMNIDLGSQAVIGLLDSSVFKTVGNNCNYSLKSPIRLEPKGIIATRRRVWPFQNWDAQFFSFSQTEKSSEIQQGFPLIAALFQLVSGRTKDHWPRNGTIAMSTCPGHQRMIYRRYLDFMPTNANQY